MKTAYDIHASKRAVNLSLNEDLVAQARSMTDNLSAEVESLLVDFVQRQQRLRQAEAGKFRRSAASWNAFGERHGAFADEFSTL